MQLSWEIQADRGLLEGESWQVPAPPGAREAAIRLWGKRTWPWGHSMSPSHTPTLDVGSPVCPCTQAPGRRKPKSPLGRGHIFLGLKSLPPKGQQIQGPAFSQMLRGFGEDSSSILVSPNPHIKTEQGEATSRKSDANTTG